MVHQLDHFQHELTQIADSLIDKSVIQFTGNKNEERFKIDRAWQAVAASRCLFDCADSPKFTVMAKPN